ncbi:unnamed protein product [Victoria cruziana]
MDERICTACANGSLAHLQELTSGDPNILSQPVPPSGSTLLHVAVEKRQLEIVSYLLDKVPELVNIAHGAEEFTALHLAATNGLTDIIRAILEKKPEAIKQVTRARENILHLMAKNGRLEAFRCIFLAYNLRKFARKADIRGNTVLHLGVISRSIELIKFIIQETVVRVNTRNSAGKTALDIAIEEHNHRGSAQIITALRDAHCISGREGRFWSRREAPDKHLYGVLDTTVIAAVLIATLAFSTLLNPPGCVYQEGPLAGRAILSTHPLFDVFLFFNVVALLTSLAIVVMQSTYVAFTRDRLICRWDVSQTLTDLSAICILIDYVIGAWLIYCPTARKVPVMVALSVTVGACIAATTLHYLLRKLRIWKELNARCTS